MLVIGVFSFLFTVGISLFIIGIVLFLMKEKSSDSWLIASVVVLVVATLILLTGLITSAMEYGQQAFWTAMLLYGSLAVLGYRSWRQNTKPYNSQRSVTGNLKDIKEEEVSRSQSEGVAARPLEREQVIKLEKNKLLTQKILQKVYGAD